MKTYLLRLTVMCIGSLVLVAGFCVVVDPYAVFGVARIEGVSLRKPYAHTRGLEAKTALFKRAQSDVLLVGDSRIDVAFDPERISFGNSLKPFNMGIPGGGVRNFHENYLMASRMRPQKTVVVGLDFIEFLVSQRDFETTRPKEKALSPSRRIVEQTLSLGALKHALLTVFAQRSKWANTMTLDGFNDRRGYERIVRSEGHFVLFESKNKSYARRLGALEPTIYETSNNLSRRFTELSEMIDDVAQGSNAIWIFNYPFHQQMHSLFEARGLGSIHEAWLKELSDLLTTKQEQFPDLQIRFLTIPDYNETSVEKVPLNGDRSVVMEHYWESIHFRTSVGSEIYRLLADETCWEVGSISPRDCTSPVLSEAQRTEYVAAGLHLTEVEDANP